MFCPKLKYSLQSSIISSFIFVSFIISSTWALDITQNTTLTSDVNGTVVIKANNVTLDLNGHIIYSPSSTALEYGIDASGCFGVTITSSNGVALVQGFKIGLYTNQSTHYLTVSNVNFYQCKNHGVKIQPFEDIYLTNVTATETSDLTGNGEGFKMYNPCFCSFNNCTATNNKRDGFDIIYAYCVAFNNCTAQSNTGNGLEIDNSVGFYYTGNNCNSNGQSGISITNEARDGTVTSCTANSNTGDGIRLNHTATGNNFYSCTTRSNSGDGIHIEDNSTSNYFESCTSKSNTGKKFDDKCGGNYVVNCNF